MLKIQLPLLAGALALLTGCTTTQSITEIMSKVEKAYTPGIKQKKLKTEIAVATLQRDKLAGKLTMKLKVPDKIRMKLVTPKETVLKGYDGKTAWEYTSKKGVRIIKGEELDEAKLQAKLLSPAMKMQKIFSSIKLESIEKVMDKKCWKLNCQPQSEYRSQPIILFVDTSSCLIVKMVETVDTADGTTKVKTYFSDYRNVGGVMCPMSVDIFDAQSLTAIQFQSIKWNEAIDNRDFSPPQDL